MFVLDTNVLSAIMGSQPVPEAAAWVAGQPAYIIAEIGINHNSSLDIAKRLITGMAALEHDHFKRDHALAFLLRAIHGFGRSR